MARLSSLLMLIALGASGCAHASDAVRPTPSRLRVLVLEPRLETELGVDEGPLVSALSTGLVRDGGLSAVTSGDLLPSEPDCLERLACLRELGRVALADYVAASSITSLGDTAMIRVRLVDVRTTGAEQTRQTVVHPADGPSLAAALEEIGRVLASPYLPPPTPDPQTVARRRRFRWLGPLLAAGLAGAVTGTYYLVRPERGGPDVVIVPP